MKYRAVMSNYVQIEISEEDVQMIRTTAAYPAGFIVLHGGLILGLQHIVWIQPVTE